MGLKEGMSYDQENNAVVIVGGSEGNYDFTFVLTDEKGKKATYDFTFNVKDDQSDLFLQEQREEDPKIEFVPVLEIEEEFISNFTFVQPEKFVCTA